MREQWTSLITHDLRQPITSISGFSSVLADHPRIRGLGLGLYIARGLVEAHGGRIWAESEPGRSVTFRFALPVSAAL